MKKFLKTFLISTMAILTLSACGSSTTNNENVNTELTGSVTLNGSTSMEKLANSLSEVFMEMYPNVLVTAQFTGSSAGIEAVSNGSADIGNSSRKLKPEEIEKGIVGNVVALDGIAIIVDEKNPIENLTIEQIQDIFSGKIKNWSELGGDDMGVVAIGREAGSGTRSAFEEITELTDKTKYAQEIESTGAVVGKVESTPGAIGYVSLDVIHNSSAKALKINDAEPNANNIKDGSYPLSRDFIMATNGDISKQKPEVQEIFNFLYSENGKTLIESIGLIPVDNKTQN